MNRRNFMLTLGAFVVLGGGAAYAAKVEERGRGTGPGDGSGPGSGPRDGSGKGKGRRLNKADARKQGAGCGKKGTGPRDGSGPGGGPGGCPPKN